MSATLCHTNGTLCTQRLALGSQPLELLLKLPAAVCALRGKWFANYFAEQASVEVTSEAILITTAESARFNHISIDNITTKCSFRVKFWQYGGWQDLLAAKPHEVVTLSRTENSIPLGVDTAGVRLEFEQAVKDENGAWTVKSHGLNKEQVSADIASITSLSMTIADYPPVRFAVTAARTDVAEHILDTINRYLLANPASETIPLTLHSDVAGIVKYDLTELRLQYGTSILAGSAHALSLVNCLPHNQTVPKVSVTEPVKSLCFIMFLISFA